MMTKLNEQKLENGDNRDIIHKVADGYQNDVKTVNDYSNHIGSVSDSSTKTELISNYDSSASKSDSYDTAIIYDFPDSPQSDKSFESSTSIAPNMIIAPSTSRMHPGRIGNHQWRIIYTISRITTIPI